jgi:hypothetical protein
MNIIVSWRRAIILMVVVVALALIADQAWAESSAAGVPDSGRAAFDAFLVFNRGFGEFGDRRDDESKSGSIRFLYQIHPRVGIGLEYSESKFPIPGDGISNSSFKHEETIASIMATMRTPLPHVSNVEPYIIASFGRDLTAMYYNESQDIFEPHRYAKVYTSLSGAGGIGLAFPGAFRVGYIRLVGECLAHIGEDVRFLSYRFGVEVVM